MKFQKRILYTFTIVSVIISLVFVFSSCNNKTKPVFFENNKTLGVDVSSHNGEIDWEKVSKTDIQYAFIRAGYRGYGEEGKISKDELAEKNIKNALKNNLQIGVYFYSQAITKEEAEEEAKFLLKIIKHHKIELPVVMDVEFAHDKNGEKTGRLYDAKLTAKEQTDICNAFTKIIKEHGYTPMIYSNSFIFNNNINTKNLKNDTLIWLADYNKVVTYVGKYDFRQFTKKGEVDGIDSKYVDLNYCYNSN